MFSIKKVDSYLFKRFIIQFLMTFLICIFILLMQFLWMHISKLVGKGIEWSVLAEFFIYAIFTLVPMALPLAILLASLMTFGNLGETFELTALKAAGISLTRIMRPLIIFITVVSICAFFFSNYVLPVSQKKLYALIISLKQKSPEFDIPVGQFYSEIPGVNIFVQNKVKGSLKNMMIYDFSGGFENATVMVADSGRVQFTADKKYLLLSLYSGETFENLKKQKLSSSFNNVPYRREVFRTKELLLDFNSSFNRLDESTLKDQQISKNISQLQHSIDSVSKIEYARKSEQGKEMIQKHYLGREANMYDLKPSDNIAAKHKSKIHIDADSLLGTLTREQLTRVGNAALDKAKSMKDQIGFNRLMLEEPSKYVRRHKIEWHRKFTLSFACLIFFFIGAPLGAIIRKGGLGMPVVISVIMFIVYYIIDNTGYKMAREAVWASYQGMWLSSFVLLPIGVFLTYKAVNDAELLNAEFYVRFWTKIKTSALIMKTKLHSFITTINKQVISKTLHK